MSLDGTSVPVTQSVLLVWTWSVCIHIAVASSSCCWPMGGRHHWQDSVALLWPLMSPFLGCLAWCGNLTWSAVSGVHRLLFCCRYCCLNCCVVVESSHAMPVLESPLWHRQQMPPKKSNLCWSAWVPIFLKISPKTLSHRGARTVISHGHEASSQRRKSWCKSSV